MSPRLTILLPLKGRSLFTLRFLWHANANRLPYHFLIADGEVRPWVAALLTDAKGLFPSLSLEYRRYPDDKTFSDFYAKMYDALCHVRTPYVMVADNDDFLIRSGIDRSIEFLDECSDYLCCGGGIAGFSVYSRPDDQNPGLSGPFNKFAFRYAAEDRSRDFGFESVAERLYAGGQYSWGYYAVFRSHVLRDIWKEVVEINLSDLMMLEWFCGLRTLTLGKARSDASVIGYLRQYWTSMRLSFPEDWVHHLLRSRFTSDFTTLIERLSASAARSDNASAAEIGERLRETFDRWYRGFLRHNYGPSGIVRGLLRRNTPGLLQWLKRRRRYSVGFERRALFNQLARHGATLEYLEEFRRELAGVDDVLTGKDFAGFLSSCCAQIRLAEVSENRIR